MSQCHQKCESELKTVVSRKWKKERKNDTEFVNLDCRSDKWLHL